jgi:integration host factor subunit beta
VTRSELVDRLTALNTQLSRQDIERVVLIFFDTISSALAEDRRVELRGFGAFSVRHRTNRKARNPRSGDVIFVDAKKIPYFRSGKRMRDRLNGRA